MAVDSMNAAAEIPDVFRRMPLELLRRYAQHGVVGARDEIRRRRTVGAFEKESKTIKCEAAFSSEGTGKKAGRG
jgi:hypothetical protein